MLAGGCCALGPGSQPRADAPLAGTGLRSRRRSGELRSSLGLGTPRSLAQPSSRELRGSPLGGFLESLIPLLYQSWVRREPPGSLTQPSSRELRGPPGWGRSPEPPPPPRPQQSGRVRALGVPGGSLILPSSGELRLHSEGAGLGYPSGRNRELPAAPDSRRAALFLETSL